MLVLMQVVRWFGLLLLAGFLAACSSLNPFASSSSAIKPAELVPFQPTLNVRTVWRMQIGAAKDAVFTPAIVDQFIYVAAADGAVAKLNAADGAVVWRINLGQTLTAGVGSNGRLVAVVAKSGELIVLDAKDGSSHWKIATNSEVLSAPIVSSDLIIVRASDSRIFGFETEQGRRRWIYQRPSPALVLRSVSGMTLSNEILYVGFPGGRLVALNIAKGTLRWEALVTLPKGATELERVADVIGTPALSAGEVCVATFQGRAGCFETANGNPVWLRDFSTSSGIAVDRRMAFLSDEQSHVVALARPTGANMWRNTQLLHRGTGVPLALNNAIVVGDARGIVHWLSREDGHFLARVSTDGSAIQTPPLLIETSATSAPMVLIQTQAGSVQALMAN